MSQLYAPTYIPPASGQLTMLQRGAHFLLCVTAPGGTGARPARGSPAARAPPRPLAPTQRSPQTRPPRLAPCGRGPPAAARTKLTGLRAVQNATKRMSEPCRTEQVGFAHLYHPGTKYPRLRLDAELRGARGCHVRQQLECCIYGASACVARLDNSYQIPIMQESGTPRNFACLCPGRGRAALASVCSSRVCLSTNALQQAMIARTAHLFMRSSS